MSLANGAPVLFLFLAVTYALLFSVMMMSLLSTVCKVHIKTLQRGLVCSHFFVMLVLVARFVDVFSLLYSSWYGPRNLFRAVWSLNLLLAPLLVLALTHLCALSRDVTRGEILNRQSLREMSLRSYDVRDRVLSVVVLTVRVVLVPLWTAAIVAVARPPEFVREQCGSMSAWTPDVLSSTGLGFGTNISVKVLVTIIAFTVTNWFIKPSRPWHFMTGTSALTVIGIGLIPAVECTEIVRSLFEVCFALGFVAVSTSVGSCILSGTANLDHETALHLTEVQIGPGAQVPASCEPVLCQPEI
jgi:hypothetical protein